MLKKKNHSFSYDFKTLLTPHFGNELRAFDMAKHVKLEKDVAMEVKSFPMSFLNFSSANSNPPMYHCYPVSGFLS